VVFVGELGAQGADGVPYVLVWGELVRGILVHKRSR
jgi:hypothetical protein